MTKLAALRALIERLETAYTLFNEAGDGGRAGVLAALDAVNDFLGQMPDAQTKKINMPLLVLRGTLNDLEHGTVSPIVAPAIKPASRAYDPILDQIIHAHAAFVADRLMALKVRGARNMVAKVLVASGYPCPDYSTAKLAKHVKSWREYYRRPETKAFGKIVYDGLLVEHCAEEAAETLLNKLTKLIAETYP